MRDLVETVIAQVMQQDKQPTKVSSQGESFKSSFMKEMHQAKPIAIEQKQGIKNKALWDVSVKFEAIFFQQMMAAMRKTVPESEFLPHGFAEGVQESMFDQAIADAGSKSGSLGIAMNIYRQLEKAQPSQDGEATDMAIQDMRDAADKEQASIYAEFQGALNDNH